MLFLYFASRGHENESPFTFVSYPPVFSLPHEDYLSIFPRKTIIRHFALYLQFLLLREMTEASRSQSCWVIRKLERSYIIVFIQYTLIYLVFFFYLIKVNIAKTVSGIGWSRFKDYPKKTLIHEKTQS